MADQSQNFRGVLVGQHAHAFPLPSARATASFRKHDLFAFTSQLLRATSRVPANFAAGFRKHTPPDQRVFSHRAQGSAGQCLDQRLLARVLACTDTSRLPTALGEVSRRLRCCINGLKRNGA